MRSTQFAALVLAAAVSTGTMLAQTAGQDMKSAGHATATATKDTGHGIAKGTKTGYHKTKSGTKVAAKDTAHGTKVAAKDTAHGTAVAADTTARGTKKLGKKIVGDKTPTTTPHNPQ